MTPKKQIDALIFDYDGVIADTEPLYWRSWADILKPLGINLTWEQYCENGRGVRDACMLDTFRQTIEDPSVFSKLEKQNALRKLTMRDLCISEPPIHKSTIEMLFSLKGYRLGLVTSSARPDVQPVLRAAGVFECFNALVFAEDVERHKPAPDPYLMLRRRLGAETGLVFEDSDAGIASAQQAGFNVVRIPEPEELSQIVYRELSSTEPNRAPN
jgi:HAD superfamily hydrolase (TIGR01509 family)